MKTITKFVYPAFALFAFACLGGTASALTVYPINNGFEQPDLGSGCDAWQYTPTSPGWTFYGGGIAANESCFDVAGATNGNNDNGATSTSGQAALLQGGDGTLAGGFAQTLTLPAAGNWVLYFSLEGRPFYDGANGVNVFLDGVQAGSTLFPANLGSFNGASVNLGNLAAGSHTIGFAGTIPEGDHTTFVDNVRLANGATGDLFASINGTAGNSGGSIYDYTPLQTTFASGLSRPRGLAFNRFGSLFVVNSTFDGVTGTFQVSIVKITSDGVQNTVATLSGDLFGEGVTFDRAGNLFVLALDDTDPNLAATIYKITPHGVVSTFGNLPASGFGVAFDSAGNLFAAGNDQTIYKFTPNGTRSVFVGPSAFTPNSFPAGLAFDRLGNLFVSTESGCPPAEPDSILKFTPDGVESTFATDLTLPRGLAFDRRGNLFVTELLCDTAGSDILEFRPDGTRRVFAVVSGQTNSGPEFLAFQLSQ